MTSGKYRKALVLIERMLDSRMEDEAVSRARVLMKEARKGAGVGLLFRSDRSLYELHVKVLSRMFPILKERGIVK